MCRNARTAPYPPVYLAGFLKKNQTRYYQALGAAQLQERWPEWVSFLAEGVVESCLDAIQTAKDLLAIRANWGHRLAHLRSDASALAALDVILGSPVITANRLKEALGVSFPTANTAIGQLMAARILAATGELKRNRAFIAPEVIARLDQPYLQKKSGPSLDGPPVSCNQSYTR